MPRKRKSELNKFYDKIFVISLFDKPERWNKVRKQFAEQGVDVERFVAVDGRCKGQGDQGCIDKLKSFEMAYDVYFDDPNDTPLIELVPAASLTIGTILILRAMVKNKWERVLICEDDVELTRDLNKTFKRGVNEIGNYKWDLLYLGCGGWCGTKGLAEGEKYGNISHPSQLNEYYDFEIYVADKRDLRMPCECIEFSDHLSWAIRPGGTWAYSYSLAGAKKVLKLIDNNAAAHIDQLLKNYTESGKLKVLAFDQPIVWHEYGREVSSIPWSW